MYTQGCFKGGEPVNYEELHPGDFKNFKDVQFEVRLDQRDWDDIPIDHFAAGDQLDDIEVESDTEKKIRLSKINDNKVTKIEDKNDKNQAMLGIY
jgi:hypothetical protein